MRKLPEAVAELRQAVHLRPDFAQAHHNLGVALAELGHLDEAALCLRQALTLQPDYAEAYYNLGNVLVNQKKPQEAVTQFHRALELRPAYGEVYNNLVGQTNVGQFLFRIDQVIPGVIGFSPAPQNCFRLGRFPRHFVSDRILRTWGNNRESDFGASE